MGKSEEGGGGCGRRDVVGGERVRKEGESVGGGRWEEEEE